MNGQPAATLETLTLRARLLARLRQFFATRNVLEVETPILSHATTPEPHLESFTSHFDGISDDASYWCSGSEGETLYLQTSPEFHMKRLLAAGSGAIYQLGKVFRQGELGRKHNPEFTMLEWYRPEWDYHALMDEVAELVIETISPWLTVSQVEKLSYQSAFERTLGIDPLTVDVATLKQVVAQQGIQVSDLGDESDIWLDLLMSHCVEPGLGLDNQQNPILTFIHDYPVSQASLAKPCAKDPRLAERFELYINGIELANGFNELTDAEQQRQRFIADNQTRERQGLPVVPLDELFLSSLNHMPPTSGVALGVDRLVMVAAGKQHLREVMAFPLTGA